MQHYRNQVGAFSKKRRVELPYDTALSFMHTYPEDSTSYYRSMFMVMLLIALVSKPVNVINLHVQHQVNG